jgi:hypothetical protein
MPTALEQTYIEIGRLYVESLSFAERVQEYLEILEFAEFSDIVEFAATTKSGKARKKPTCNPAKSQLCGGSCVALSKQCRKNATGAEKQAAGFVADVAQAKKKGGAKVAGSAKQKTSGAAETGLNLLKTMTKVRAEAEKAKPVEPAVSAKPNAKKAEDENDQSQFRSMENLNYKAFADKARTPVKFIEGKSDASEAEIKAIAGHLKTSKKNILPVFVRETGEDKFEVVANGHILDAARKAKLDFVQTIALDKDQERQVMDELSKTKKPDPTNDDRPDYETGLKSAMGEGAKAGRDDENNFGVVLRLPAKFVEGKSDAPESQVNAIAGHLKTAPRNITPVIVRQVGEDEYTSVANGQILEGARKAKSDFVHAIVINKAMEPQALAEMGISTSSPAATKSKAASASTPKTDSKAKLFEDVKALELQADVLKKNPASGGIIDRLTVVADSLKRNALREDLKSGAVSMGVISQLAGGVNDKNSALASASDRVVAEAYRQLPVSTKNQIATKRGEFLVESTFPAGSETAKVQADLKARRDRIRSGAS